MDVECEVRMNRYEGEGGNGCKGVKREEVCCGRGCCWGRVPPRIAGCRPRAGGASPEVPRRRRLAGG